jgi:hypothetical protein
MEETITPRRRNGRKVFASEHANVDDRRVAKPARDVPAGECWAFTDHRTVAEIIAEGLL